MRFYLIIVLIFIFSLPTVFSLNDTLTIFTFRDITSNELIDDVGVYIIAEEEISSFFIPEGGVLRVVGLDREVDISIKLDDYSTPGNDYYQILKAGIIDTGVNNLYLFPVGSIRGIVKDNLDNVVPYAKLKFDCGKKFDFPDMTDEFGSFFVDYIPVGDCMVYASYGEATGSAALFMVKGNLSDVQILLDKGLIVSKRNGQYDLWFVVLIVAILAFSLYLFKKRAKKPIKAIAREEKISEEKVDRTTEKLFETLNPKEKKVVEYLMDNNNSAQQSSIRHATHIPRTSLKRVVDSLENKKIISVEKHGKSIKLTLTDFFLDKD